MSEMMLALLGFATIIMIIVLLLRNVTVPAIAFIGVSTVTALILVLTGTFSIRWNIFHWQNRRMFFWLRRHPPM